MTSDAPSFSALFKKYRLRSEIRTLAEFGDLLAEEGFVYENSLFTRWQNGERVPKDRKLLLAIITLFAKRGGIVTLLEADDLLASVQQRDLEKNERSNLKQYVDTTKHSESTRANEKSNKNNAFLMPYLSRRILIIVAGLLILVFGLIHFQRDNQSSRSSITSDKLIVGTDPTLNPMEYYEGSNVVGYDIDLVHHVARALNKEVEFRHIVFNDLFEELERGEVMMVVSAVTITNERKSRFDFSEPYLNAGQVIVTRTDTTLTNLISDLQGRRIATQKGTTNESEALNFTSEDLIIPFPDFIQATNALKNGDVDALFTDLPNAGGIVRSHPDLKIASDPITVEQYGIVFRKGDPLVNEVNAALMTLRVSGVMAQLSEKWLE